MPNVKHVVYLGQLPGQGTGSPINMLRHLQRFKKNGWHVSVIADWGQDSGVCEAEGWKACHLPHRRTWWPPYRPANTWLRAMRMRLWARECGKMFNGCKPDAILTYLSFHSELMSEIAAHYSRLAKIPMTTIVYDDALAFKEHSIAARKQIGGRFRWILQQSHQNWFVSRQLATAYGFPPDPETVLMPMPERIGEQVKWRDEFSQRPLLVYAGFLYEQQFPLLRRLAKVIKEAGGQLMILSRETRGVRRLCAESPIEFQPLLPTNREALEFVGKRAAGFLAAYCDRVEDMPWIKSSFPSKVVEFGQLGLPILFVSPRESAVYAWCEEQSLPYNICPDEIVRVTEFTAGLKDPVQWNGLAEPIRRLAESEFNPDLIQGQLVQHLI